MDLHLLLVYFAKSYGLVYFFTLSLLIVLYVYWPSNKDKFDDAANQIIDDEDWPCH